MRDKYPDQPLVIKKSTRDGQLYYQEYAANEYLSGHTCIDPRTFLMLLENQQNKHGGGHRGSTTLFCKIFKRMRPQGVF